MLLDEAELRHLRNAARRQGLPVSEWVRRAIREARRREPEGDIEAKLKAVRAAVRHQFPTADIAQMLEETERGYTAAPPE